MSKRTAALLSLLAAVVIVTISLLPTAAKHGLHIQGRLHPWLHVLAYAALGLGCTLAVAHPPTRLLLLCAVAGLGWATEFAESLLDGWQIERHDVFLDLFGVLLGWVIGMNLRSRRQRRRPTRVDFPASRT